MTTALDETDVLPRFTEPEFMALLNAPTRLADLELRPNGEVVVRLVSAGRGYVGRHQAETQR